MSQYKVPQNVESEDKLIGPLSMKQFIYAIIGAGWGFLIWRVFLPGGAAGIPFMIILILPISGFMFLIAFGRREEQSFENYLIALIRFKVMPRRRLWMKDNTVDRVIVDTPVAPPPPLPTQEDMDQVHSRLQQLALVVDTRGHVKSDSIQVTDPQNTAAQFSQRVFTPQSLQQEMLPNQMQVQDDILSNVEAGPRADTVGMMLQNVEHDIHDQAVAAMSASASPPLPAAREANSSPEAAPIPPMTPSQTAANDAILKTVMNTSDLSVAQVARAANTGQLSPGQAVQL